MQSEPSGQSLVRVGVQGSGFRLRLRLRRKVRVRVRVRVRDGIRARIG